MRPPTGHLREVIKYMDHGIQIVSVKFLLSTAMKIHVCV